MNRKLFLSRIGFTMAAVLLMSTTMLNAQRVNPKKNALVRHNTSQAVEKYKSPVAKTCTRDGVTVTTIVSDYMFPYDISQNGQHVAGQEFGEGASFYWSEATGITPIEGTVFAVSETGIIGGYYLDETLGASVAGLWNPTTQAWTFLGINPAFPQITPDVDYNDIWGMNSDGTICVGMQFNNAWAALPYKWTQAGGYEMLNYPENANSSRPDAVSDDGTVICGHIDWNPAVWHNGTYTIISEDGGEAFNVSPNGLYVVGSSGDGGFIWNSTTATAEFFSNTLQTGSLSPLCVANDGTIFGYAVAGFPPFPASRVAFVRNPDGSMQSFNDYAGLRGLPNADQWLFYSINSVTADGNILIGAGIDPDGNTVSFKMEFEEVVYNCDPPTDLTFEVTDENWNDIVLNWTAPENATNVTYNIYANSGSTTPLFSNITTTTFTDMDKPAGTYTYVVRANWSDTCLSAATNRVSATVYDCAPSDMCNLIFDLNDEYGDGWNGASIQVTNATGATLATITLSNGNTGQEIIPFCQETTLNFIWNVGGYDGECTFSISNEYGVVLYAQTTAPNPGQFFSCLHSCEEPESVVVSGTVSALSNNAPIENAQVVFEGIFNPSITTDATGFYSVELMIGEIYNISITASGYNQLTQNGYEAPATDATLNFQMTAPVLEVNPTSVNMVANHATYAETTVTLSNTGNGPLNFSSNIAYQDRDAKSGWDLLHSFNTAFSGEQGICTDGINFYTCFWNAPGQFGKYDMQGNFLQTFTIEGVGAIRDLTYDGTYFYGGDGTSTLYTFDLFNQTLVENVTTEVTGIRHCSYDVENDGFWIGNWTTLFLVNRAGTILQTGAALTGAYGSGYDQTTAGGPYLLLHCQIGNNTAKVFRYKISNSELTEVFDMSTTPGYSNGSSGGAFIGEYNSKICFIGNIQQSPNLVAIYELGSSGWLSIDPSIGTIAAGESQVITLTANGWHAESGEFDATATFSSIPNVGDVAVDVHFTINAPECDAPTNLTAELSDWSNIALSWTAPANSAGVTYNLYSDATSQTPLVSGITQTSYLVENQPIGIYTYVVRAIWSDGCISNVSNEVEIETFPCNPETMCDITIDMEDTYGDGWNGASITVTNDGVQIASITLENGNSGQIVITVCPGVLDFVWVAGSYDDECSFTITNSFGTIIYDGSTIPPAGSFLNFNNTCQDIQTVIVSGIVSNEEDNSPISGATVTFEGANGQTVATGSTGNYEVELTAGFTYNITISATGFEPYAQNGYVAPSENTTLDFELTLTPCNIIPQNVEAIASNNNITVTWNQASDTWLTWSGEFFDAIGMNAAADFSVAQRFEPSDIAIYNGMIINKVKFIPNEANCTYSIRIWTGGNISSPAELIVDQEVLEGNFVLGEWNEFDLETPVTIDASQELWIGYRCNTQAGHPAGCDSGPEVAGKGNMIFTEGAWYQLTDLAAQLTYNWCIQGLVTSAKGETVALSALTDHSNSTANGIVEAAGIEIPQTATSATRSLTFNVYRDGVQIATNIAEMTYTDSELENGIYCYTITTTCENGVESDPSEEDCEIVNVGINEMENGYEIFPNPAHTSVTIKGENIESVAVYNALGQWIENVATTAKSVININTTNYNSGVYIFRIENHNGNVISKRIVIVH